MIKWTENRENLNIKDIIKVINILPCTWAEDYSDYNRKKGLIVPKPIKDGANLIYSVSDVSDGYVIMYYKCTADGTILEVGEDDEEE